MKAIGLALLAAGMFGSGVLQRGMPADLEQVGLGRLTAVMLLEAASWAAAPIYAWLVCQGVARTGSVGRYAARVAVLALASEVPYDLASSGQVWDMASQNPVFAVLASLAVLALGRGAKLSQTGSRASKAAFWAMLALAGAVWLAFFNVGLRLGVVPTGLLLLAFALVFYFGQERPNTMMLVGSAIGVLGGIAPAFGLVFLHFRSGREGMRHRWDRRAFYALYPLALLAAGLWRVAAP
ncbi:MAG: ABC transporter permease [Bifidobacteriaceae bacterium]|nr:ABC transporter permease [Bifidobacteriaceae bacterium]